MKKINSKQRRYSRYVQGGQTGSTADRLGFWDRTIMSKSDDDDIVTIETHHQHSPWLLSFERYGTVELMWFIFQYNNILDPATEFVAGRKLRLPTHDRLHVELLTGRPEV